MLPKFVGSGVEPTCMRFIVHNTNFTLWLFVHCIPAIFPRRCDKGVVDEGVGKIKGFCFADNVIRGVLAEYSARC